MILHRLAHKALNCGLAPVLALGLALGLAGCSGTGSGWFSGNQNLQYAPASETALPVDGHKSNGPQSTTTLTELFTNNVDPNTSVQVSKYIWAASLDVLSFLPIESVDPFTGVIVTGYGTPPGSGRSYRATVYIQDPALDARSLRVAMQTRGGGPVDADTIRAVEDAILTRARQLRIQDGNL